MAKPEVRSFVLRAMVAASQVLLPPGLVLDDYRDDSGRTDHLYSVVGMMSAGFSYRNEDDEHSASDSAIGGDFLLLIVVVLATVLTLCMVWRRQATRRAAGWAGGLAVLLILGVLSAGRMWLISRSGLQPAALVLTAGALLTAALVLPAQVRAWWTADS